MSASSDDAFYSAPEDTFYSAPESSPSNPNPIQIQHQDPSPHLNPIPESPADHNQQHLTPPSDKWLLRIASSAGKVISSILRLSDESSSDNESDGDGDKILSSHEEIYESSERIKKLNKVMALGEVDELKAARHLFKSEELVPQETLSREPSEKPLNPAQSPIVGSSSPSLHPKDIISHNQLVQVPVSPVQASVQIHSVRVPEAKKLFENNKNISSSLKLPLNPNISTLPGKPKELALTNTKPPLNPNLDHSLSCSPNQEPFSDIIPPVNPFPFPLAHQNQQQELCTIIPPVKHLPSPSLSQSQKAPSHCAPLLNPNVSSPSTNQKQKSPHPLILSPERQSKPCCKRNKLGTRTTKYKVTEKEIPEVMTEERSGSKRWASSLEAVIELFPDDLNAKQPGDTDLLDVLEMKGITFEDPSWWPK